MSTYINNRLFAYSYLPINNQTKLNNYINSLILIGSEQQLYQPLTQTYVGIGKTAYNNLLKQLDNSLPLFNSTNNFVNHNFYLLSDYNNTDNEKNKKSYFNNNLYFYFDNNNNTYLNSSYFKGWLNGTSTYSLYSYNSDKILIKEISQDDYTYYNILFTKKIDKYNSSYIYNYLKYNPYTNTVYATYFNGWLKGTADHSIDTTYSTYADYSVNTYVSYLKNPQYTYIALYQGGNSYQPTLIYGNLYYDKNNGILHTNISGNATTATKLGTANKGSATQGIYLDHGEPKVMTHNLNATVNSGIVGALTYYNTSTSIQNLQTSYGSATKLIYISNGILKESNENVGFSYKPIYLSNGTITAGLAYAGGNRIKLNGTTQNSGEIVSFYAPTAGGTSGQILQSNGSGIPTWIDAESTHNHDNRYIALNGAKINNQRQYISLYQHSDNPANNNVDKNYIKLATITLTATYANDDLEFNISNRDNINTKLNIMFNGVNDTVNNTAYTSVKRVNCHGEGEYYILNAYNDGWSSHEWELWGKTKRWCWIGITSYSSSIQNRVLINVHTDSIWQESLPSTNYSYIINTEYQTNNLLPYSNNGVNLGSPDYYWKTAYITNIYGDLTGTADNSTYSIYTKYNYITYVNNDQYTYIALYQGGNSYQPTLIYGNLYYDKINGILHTNISGNASTANNAINSTYVEYAEQLKTSVNIWGQSFDGSSDVSGDLNLDGNILLNVSNISAKDTNATIGGAGNEQFNTIYSQNFVGLAHDIDKSKIPDNNSSSYYLILGNNSTYNLWYYNDIHIKQTDIITKKSLIVGIAGNSIVNIPKSNITHIENYIAYSIYSNGYQLANKGFIHYGVLCNEENINNANNYILLAGGGYMPVESLNTDYSKYSYNTKIYHTEADQTYYITFSNTNINDNYSSTYVDTSIKYNPLLNKLTIENGSVESYFIGDLNGKSQESYFSNNSSYSTYADYSVNTYVSYLKNPQYTYIALYQNGNSYQPTFICSKLYYDKNNYSSNSNNGILHTDISGNAESATNAINSTYAEFSENIKGGKTNQIAYQSNSNITEFIDIPESNTYLKFDGSKFIWTSIGDNDTWRPVIITQDTNTYTLSTADTLTLKNGTGISLSYENGGKITINHSNSITAGTIVGSNSINALDFGDTINIPSITYDENGHITDWSTTSIKLPNDSNIDEKVKQVPYTGDGSYYLLFAYDLIPNENSSSYVKYNSSISFNTNTHTLCSTYFDGYLKGSADNSTYSIYTKYNYITYVNNDQYTYIALYQGGNSYQPTLIYGNLYYDKINGILHTNISGNATSANIATVSNKLGNNTIGSTTQGIYLDNGEPKVMTHNLNATVNSGIVGALTYYNTSTSIQNLQTSYGSATRLIYIYKGILNESNENVGFSYKPIYLSNGTITEGLAYAGGTKITLNGNDKGSSTTSFYAPTAGGTSNQILRSNGSNPPTWVNITGSGSINVSSDKHGIIIYGTDTNIDEKVKQWLSNDNKEYSLLFAYNDSITNGETSYIKFDTDIKVNPSTNTVYAACFNGLLKGTADYSIYSYNNYISYLENPQYTYIALYQGGNSYQPTLIYGNLYYDKNNGILHTNISGNATTATKLGTANKGSATQGIYLDHGEPKVMTHNLNATVNSGIVGTLAYYNTATSIKNLQTNYGNATKLIYISNGKLNESDENVGFTYKPVYLSNGTITEGLAYAGGNRIKLNGTTQNSGEIVSFYAPTAGGTSGQILISNGLEAPSWIDAASTHNHDNRYIALNGAKTNNQRQYVSLYQHSDSNVNYSYIQLATIKITSTYANDDLEFNISNRDNINTKLNIMFNSSSTTSTSIKSVNCHGEGEYYILNSYNNGWSSHEWELWGKTEKWCWIGITSYSSSIQNRVSINVHTNSNWAENLPPTNYSYIINTEYQTNNLLPYSNNTVNLGSPDYYWKTAYITNIYGDLKGTADNSTYSTYTKYNYIAYVNDQYTYIALYKGGNSYQPTLIYGNLYYDKINGILHTNISGNATSANNITGGNKNSISYQTAANTTDFINAPNNSSNNSYVLTYTDNQLKWKKYQDINTSYIQTTLNINENWNNLYVLTGGPFNLTTGTYIAQLFCQGCVLSGIFSFNNVGTDEIILHASGNPSNRLYLRTNGSNMQISSDRNIGSKQVTLTIKQLI